MGISIVIPVYNTERFLNRCIDSVLDQTFKDIEIILVDDGSIDKSPSICDEYARMDERVHVYHNSNRGANESRKFGVLVSRMPFVLFVDSDDWLPDYALEYMSSSIDDGVDIVVGFKWDSPDPERRISIQEWRNICARGGIFMSPIAKLFRKELLSETVFNIPSHIKVCEDDVMNIRVSLAANNDVMIMKRQCYYYNDANDGSITKNWHWTYQYLGELYDVISSSYSDAERDKYINSLIWRRLDAVNGLIADYPYRDLRGLSNSYYLEKLKNDIKSSSFNLSPMDKITLACPESRCVYGFHKVRKKIRILKEFIQRRLNLRCLI